MIFPPILHENKYSSNKNKHVTKKAFLKFEKLQNMKGEGKRCELK
jgi:hypothetical protein